MIIFSFDYPPVDGGISRLCAGIAMEINRRSMRVTVVSQKTDNAEKDRFETHRVTRSRPARELFAILKLRKLKKKDETILCGIWYPEGLLAILAGYKNIFLLGHGNELMPYTGGWRKLLWNPLRRWVLSRASYIFGDSDYSAKLVHLAAPEAQVRGLPLPVDHRYFVPGDKAAGRTRFGIDREVFTLGTVSRLVRYKGHELVFEAIAGLSPEVRKNISYAIAGKGPDENYLRQRAEEFGIESSVQWLGFIDNSELPLFYQALDLFVLSTREDPVAHSVEGFGLALLEAQSCGIPVVGTRCGGIPDAVDEESGFLIDPGAPKALVQILKELTENKAKALQLGKMARHRVEKECTWDRYLDSMINIVGKKQISITGSLECDPSGISRKGF